MDHAQKKSKLLIAGGGTGGHVLMGVAVGEAWKEAFGASTPIVYVGARGRIEEKLIPPQGWPLYLLSLGSLKHVGIVRRFATLIQLPFAFVKSFSILLKERPGFVIGVGGYASGPFLLVAATLGRLIGVRSAIIEPNAMPGFTNRVLGRWVHRVFVSVAAAIKYFPAQKTIETGNPIRAVMHPMPSAAREPFVIFVFGGSQGAVGMNTLVLESLPRIQSSGRAIQFVHQTGERDYERVNAAHRRAGTNARVEKFIDDMPAIYRAASLLVCRAGAATLSEVAAVGRSAIFVPLPTAADDHQLRNAQVYVEAGAAKVLDQRQAKGDDLADMILDLATHPEKIQAMEKNVSCFYRPNAAKDLVKAFSQ